MTDGDLCANCVDDLLFIEFLFGVKPPPLSEFKDGFRERCEVDERRWSKLAVLELRRKGLGSTGLLPLGDG